MQLPRRLLIPLLSLLMLTGRISGEADKVNKSVVERSHFFHSKVKQAIKESRPDLLGQLVKAADLILQRVPSEELHSIATDLLATEATIGEFIRFVKTVPFDGADRLVRETFRSLSRRPATEVIKSLTLLHREFPLIVGKSFARWLNGLDDSVRLQVATAEELLAEGRMQTRVDLKTDAVQTFMQSVGELVTGGSSPMELISKGYWRTGIALLESTAESEANIEDLLSGLIDYPRPFSQLFALEADNLGTIPVLPSQTKAGLLFRNALAMLMDRVEIPVPLCQTESGETILLDGSIFIPMAQLGLSGKIEVVHSLIAWLTLKTHDELPIMRHLRRASAAQVFNDTVISFCSKYDGLYPGIYVDAATTKTPAPTETGEAKQLDKS